MAKTKKLPRGSNKTPSSTNKSKKQSSVSPSSFATPPRKKKKNKKSTQTPTSTSSSSTASTKRSFSPSPTSNTVSKKFKTLNLGSKNVESVDRGLEDEKLPTKKTKKKVLDDDDNKDGDDDDDDDDEVSPKATTKKKRMEKKKKTEKLDEAKACLASMISAGFTSPTVAQIAASRANPETEKKKKKKAKKMKESSPDEEKKEGKKEGKKEEEPGPTLPILIFIDFEEMEKEWFLALLRSNSDLEDTELEKLKTKEDAIAEFLHLYTPMELKILFTFLHNKLNTPEEELMKLMEGLGKWNKKKLVPFITDLIKRLQKKGQGEEKK